MTTLLLAMLLQVPQAPPAEKPEDLIKQLFQTKDHIAHQNAKDKLRLLGDVGQAAARDALLKHLQGRREIPPPSDLVKRLDGLAVLDLQEYGLDAAAALEDAARDAQGDRKLIVERLLQRAKEQEQRGPSSVFRLDPISALVSVLSFTKVADDELLLIRLLAEPGPRLREEILTQLRYYPLTQEGFVALLAAADVRPISVGRVMWSALFAAPLKEDLDWRKLLKDVGPWSRAVAAVRLKDPVSLEQAFDDRSSLVRSALLDSLPTLPVDAETRTPFLARVLAKRSEDPSAEVRSAVSRALQQNSLDAPDVRLALLLNEPNRAFNDGLIYPILQSKTGPSEKALLRVFEPGNLDLVVKLAPVFTPARYPNISAFLIQAHEKAGPKERRSIAYILARYSHEIGRTQVDADLKSTNVQEVLQALEEIARYRLAPFADQAWSMMQHPNSQVAGASRMAAILLGAAAHGAEVEKMITSDPQTRVLVARSLRDNSHASDLPLVTLLARSPDHIAQEAAVEALERMEIRQVNDALTALKNSSNADIRRRVDGILGKFEFPALLPTIIGDLVALDPRKRAEALQRYNLTDRTGIRYRVVEGPAAMKEKVVDVPVPTVQALIADSHQAADDIFNNLVAEPLPASLTNLNTLVRANPTMLVHKVIKRGNKEDVQRLYAQGIQLAEAGPLAQFASEAREIAPEAVDAFLSGWLRNPPVGARKDVITRSLALATGVLPAPQVKEILVALFRDARPDVHQAPVEVVRKNPALAFPAEAVALWREGKIKEKYRLLPILGAARSPEGEALLREWVKDSVPTTRAQSAQALARLVHADALPILGESLFDYYTLHRWWVLTELSPGIGPAHRALLLGLLATATEEQKPIVEVLLYLSGSDAQRDRYLSHFPEEGNDRRPYILALENRAAAVDDALVESLIRADQGLRSAPLYLKTLVKSDTVKAAELARFLLDGAYRQGAANSPEFGAGCELVARRLAEPPLELLGQYAFLFGPSAGAVRALAGLNTEAAVAQLIRVADESNFGRTRETAASALRTAKRFPALQQQVRAKLGDSSYSSRLGSCLAVLCYLERDPESLDLLLNLIKRPGVLSVVRLAVLQTLLTIPGGEVKVEKELQMIPRDIDGSEFMIAEFFRVIVKGGAPKPSPDGNLGARLFLASWVRDRKAAAEFLHRQAHGYTAYRDVLEVIANRPLPGITDAIRWAKDPGPNPTTASMAAELKALGYDDPRKALRDERNFVRANAAWLLQKQAGRGIVSRGPWVGIAIEDAADGMRWIFSGPTAEEIEALDKR